MIYAVTRSDATAGALPKDSGRAVKNAGIFNSNWLKK